MAAKKPAVGKKGSSPNVYKYFKIEGDKISRGRKGDMEREKRGEGGR